ncbi:hypothetical protein ACP70R_007564 [Stipagrostis hirtigluma subsp. patula]
MLSSSRPAAAFTAQQLRQMRAQCLVFLAFRNNMEPNTKHLEIALGECPGQGGGGGGDRRGADIGDGGGGSSSGEILPASSSQMPSSVGLPPAHLLPVASLRLSSGEPKIARSRRRNKR